ncbi:MAG: hypothetical protein JO157_04695 [Acetobacteraceae bacterium]|nr:hypothetical protein [Acetobacteraceae bacterium]
MLVFGVVASELSLSLYRVAIELAFTPLDTLLVFANGGARAWGGGQSACGDAAEGTCCDQDHTAPRPRQPARDSSYAAQLRRAAPVVRLFAVAAPGAEKEAAYHALVRLAAVADAVLDLG